MISTTEKQKYNSPLRRLSKTGKTTWLVLFFAVFLFLLADSKIVSAADLTLIPAKYLKLVSADSYNPSYPPKYAIDGNPATFWHTQWGTAVVQQPHQIVIDIGSSQPIAGLQYLPRQDGKNAGYVKDYEIYISSDTSSWGSVVASGAFDIFKGDTSQKEVTFTEKTGRYVKFVSLSEVSGTPYTAAAEIKILATSFTPPVSAADLTLIPAKYLKLVSADSYNPSYPPKYAIDGNPATFWHTQWGTAVVQQPHQIVIDIGSSQPIAGLQYLPRQDGSNYGYIKDYEVYVSDTTSSWGTAVASGAFDIFRGDTSQKETLFAEKSGRYIKFVSLSNASGTAYAAAAEIKILATSFTPPAALGPEISVGIWNYTRDASQADAFEIEANESYVIKDRNGKLLATLAGSAITKVKYDTDGNIKVYNSIPEKIVDKEVTFGPAKVGSGTIVFNAHRPDSTYDEYRGKIKVRYGDTSKLIWIINILPMEHYIWGIGEITGTGDEDYNRTMTTAFRTYGYWKILYSTKYAIDGFKVDATSASQIYRGYKWEVAYPRIKAAALYTQGKIAKYGSDIALTPFSSWTDGRTRSFEERWGGTSYPWCQSVADPYGKHATMTTAQLVAAGNHMVGISAHGALKLATDHNWAWDKILKYYLTGITITKIY